MQKGFDTGQPRAADLTSHGTDGIGVFEDGKFMVLIDSQAYAITDGATAIPAQPQERLCFAMVTVFQNVRIIKSPQENISMKGFEELLSSVDVLPGVGGTNSILPFKIKGTFINFKGTTTSGHTANIASCVKGTLFGFRIPAWMEAISGPRLHCHFVSDDEDGRESVGGRVTSFEVGKDAVIGIGKCGRFHLGFPQGEQWEGVNLSGD